MLRLLQDTYGSALQLASRVDQLPEGNDPVTLPRDSINILLCVRARIIAASTQTRTCTHICIYIYIYIYLYACMHACMHTYVIQTYIAAMCRCVCV